ncbi:MAG TPA: sigma-70 family RNA polymerase sigma factor [Dongiaceae bacterium]|nr:sigma-70 family RNA polymerase sigma factor [Dongiaceae bacterium]
MDSTPHPLEGGERRDWRLPQACDATVWRLFTESQAMASGLSLGVFRSALTRSAAKRFGSNPPAADKINSYFATLHAADLALACACAEGLESAWNDFVAHYQGYLRSAAAAILRCHADDAAAIELADSLFADLYGVSDNKIAGRSLFRYFHGRSSLKTWLRAVLAQRHIDTIRAGRRFDSLDEENSESRMEPLAGDTAPAPPDPHRAAYMRQFTDALAAALGALDKRDAMRLKLYYAEDLTLAEIGRRIGEHESSVSRNLERVRRELRETVEGLLRAGKAAANGAPATPGMDQAQIDLCLEYAAENAPIDLDRLFAPPESGGEGGANTMQEPKE